MTHLISRTRRALALLPLFAGAALAGGQTYALKDARVVNGRGPVLEKATVVVRDGLIEALGADVTPPFDAEVIEAKGWTLVPGFIDAHASLSALETRTEAGGATGAAPARPSEGPKFDTSRDAQAGMPVADYRVVWAEQEVAATLRLDEAGGAGHRQAGFTTALCAPRSTLLGGRSALVNLGGAPVRESLLQPVVAAHAALRSGGGFGGGGFGGGGYPSTTMGMMSWFRQVLLDARRHRQLWVQYRAQPGTRRPPQDATLDALLPVLDGAIPLVFDASSETDIRRVIGLCKEFGIRPVISGGAEAWKVAPLLKQEGVTVILTLDFGREPADPHAKPETPARGAGPGGGRRPRGRRRAEGEAAPAAETAERAQPEAPKPEEEKKPEEPAAPAQVQEPARPADPARPEEPARPGEPRPEVRPAAPGTAGAEEDDEAPLRVREDRRARWIERVKNASALAQAGVPIVFGTGGRSPADFMTGLRQAIEQGLPRDVALRALTTDAARLVGMEGQLGTLEVGRAANLVALTGDLGAAQTRVRAVFVDGRKFDVQAAAAGREGGPPAAGLDVTGTWTVSLESPMGAREATLELKQDGAKVTGTYKSEMGEMKLEEGSLAGRTLTLPLRISLGERSISMDLEGQVSADGRSIAGTASGRFGTFDWKATRQGGPR